VIGAHKPWLVLWLSSLRDGRASKKNWVRGEMERVYGMLGATHTSWDNVVHRVCP
jgi:hypothetical protein